jgi:hypothetical protein
MIALLSVLGANSAFADDGSIVHFGPILKEVVKWTVAAFGTALAAVGTAALYKIMSYFGVQATVEQRAVLQGVIVNGLNDAAVKAEASLAANPKLDVDVKSKIITDAVTYAQAHAADTIKALGLDPQSGQAVEAIRANIATAIADPSIVTPAVLGGAQPLAPK